MSLKSANEALKQEKALALYERDCYAEKAIKLNCDFDELSRDGYLVTFFEQVQVQLLFSKFKIVQVQVQIK